MTDDGSTRDEILGGAYAVLVEEGYDGFTTQAVADEAGVSQSLVHYYFETKDDLVQALFEGGLEHLTAEVERRADAEDPRERLLELVRYAIRDEGAEDAVSFKRMLLEVKARAPYDDGAYEVVEYDHEFLHSYLAAAIEEGIDEGQFREVDPDAFARLLLAATLSAQNWTAIYGEDAPTEPVLTAVETLVDDYLVEGSS